MNASNPLVQRYSGEFQLDAGQVGHEHGGLHCCSCTLLRRACEHGFSRVLLSWVWLLSKLVDRLGSLTSRQFLVED